MKYSYKLVSDYIAGNIGKREMLDYLDSLGLNPLVTSEEDGDLIFELETPANRGYLLSLSGVAREILPFTGSALKLPDDSLAENIEAEIPVKIENRKDCPYYSCRIMKDVSNGVSPEWMEKSLGKMGYRSSFNTVDASNFVMAETGQPLHIFDLDRIEGRVEIRRGRKGESVVTIDGKKREIDGDVLVIADEVKIIAVAGIMGCEVSEVRADTKNILIESAVFNPAVVRRGSKKLGLTTEASLRFERGIDSATSVKGMSRVTHLINKTGKGNVGKLTEAGKREEKVTEITLEVCRVGKVLGIKVEESFIADILERLNFLTEKGKNTYKIVPPPYRNDIKEDVDIIEEIARYGKYSEIPSLMPVASISPTSPAEEIAKVEKIKDIAVKLGFSEFINMGLTNKRNTGLSRNKEAVPLENPISANLEFLRSSLIPEVLESIQFNICRDFRELNVFELGKVYSGISTEVQEEENLLFASVNSGDFFSFKGRIEKFFSECGFKNLSFSKKPHVFASDNNELALSGKAGMGNIFVLSPDIQALYGLDREDIYVCELYLDRFIDEVNFKRSFVELARFPSCRRDFSFIFPQSIVWEKIKNTIFSLGLPVEKIDFFDLYRGKNMEKGKISVSFAVLFRHPEKTLENAEVKDFSEKIVKAITNKLKGRLRGENTKC